MSEAARRAQRAKMQQARNQIAHDRRRQILNEAEASETNSSHILEPLICDFCGNRECFWFGELVEHVKTCSKSQYALPIGAGDWSVQEAAKILAANMCWPQQRKKHGQNASTARTEV